MKSRSVNPVVTFEETLRAGTQVLSFADLNAFIAKGESAVWIGWETELEQTLLGSR